MAGQNVNQPGDVYDAVPDQSMALDWLWQIMPFFKEGKTGDGLGQEILGTEAWSQALLTFNGSLLTIASLFLVWNFIAGLVDAAWDGRPFANKAHVAWGPLRAVGGIGLVAPIPGIGASLAQALVLLVAIAGSSFGSEVWSSTVEAAFPKKENADERRVGSILSPVTSNGTGGIIEDIIDKEVCHRHLREKAGDVTQIMKARGVLPAEQAKKIRARDRVVPDNVQNSVPNSNYPTSDPAEIIKEAPAFSGSGSSVPLVADRVPIAPVAFSRKQQQAIDGDVSAENARYGWIYGAFCGATYVNVPRLNVEDGEPGTQKKQKARNAFGGARVRALQNAVARLRGEGDQVTPIDTSNLNADPPTPAGGFNRDAIGYIAAGMPQTELAAADDGAAATAFQSTGELKEYVDAVKRQYVLEMRAAARRFQTDYAQGEVERFVTAATNGGWAMAGSTWTTIAGINARTVDLATQKPSNMPIKWDSMQDNWTAPIRERVTAYKRGFANLQRTSLGAVDMDELFTRSGAEEGTFEEFIAGLQKRVKGVFDVNPNRPYVSLIEVGRDSREIAVWSGMSGVAAYSAGSLLEDVPFVGGLASGAGFVAFVVAVIFLIPAVMFGYILPFMPFIYFAFGVLTWLINILEGFFGLPFWSVMSARLEGDELFHQSQKAGLGKLVLIFTRPVLMVLGVIASFVLFMAFSYFLAMTFVGVANVNEGLVNDYGILSGIVSLLIFSYLVWYGATRCLSLINTLPQKTGEWMGLGISDSQGEDRDVQNVQGAIVGYAGARGVQAVSGPAGAAANRAERAASRLPSAKGSSTKVTPDN